MISRSCSRLDSTKKVMVDRKTNIMEVKAIAWAALDVSGYSSMSQKYDLDQNNTVF